MSYTVGVYQNFACRVGMTDSVMGYDARVVTCIGVDEQITCRVQAVDVIPENLATCNVLTASHSDDGVGIVDPKFNEAIVHDE